MKLIVLLAGFAFTLMTGAASAQQSIMVTGDSVASGWNQPSYRLPLLDSLSAQGCSVDMVGDQNANSFDFRNAQSSPGVNIEPFTPGLGYDTDHQAFASVRAAQLLSGVSSDGYTVLPIAAYTLAHQPDYVLLHLGTSDLKLTIANGTDSAQEINDWATQTTNEVEAVINQILANHYRADKLRILLANFVPHTGLFEDQSQLDAAALASTIYSEKLEFMVAAKADHRVLIVDVATDFDVNTMLASDRVHPNSVGEQHIAGAFLPILKGAGLCSDSVPMIAAPANGSVVTGESVTVEWRDNGLAVDNWRVYVGDSQSGNSSTLFDSGVLGSAVRSVVVPGLPEDRSNHFIALHYQVDGIWDLFLTSFISESTTAAVDLSALSPALAAANGVARSVENDAPDIKNLARIAPELLSPSPGSQLPGTEVILKWTDNGVRVKQWYVRVGLSKGTTEFADLRITDPDTTQLRVNGLPRDGNTPVFVQFSYRQASDWVVQNFQYRASDRSDIENQPPAVDNPVEPDPVIVVPTGGVTRPGKPALVSPLAGTQLPGKDVTFKWIDNGVQPDQWYFRVGLSKGTTEFAGLRITNPDVRQLRVKGLPTDGGTPVFVEFSYRKGGDWIVQNVEYLASGDVNTVNQPPVAKDDIVGPMDIGTRSTFSVTGNDTDPDGVVVASSVEIVAQPRVGKAIVESDGQITYTHDGTLGTVQDVMRYTVLDDDGNKSESAIVRITPFNTPEKVSQPTSTPTDDSKSLTTPLLKSVDLSFDNSTWSGNPFDLVATGTFIHQGSNAVRTGEMFYAGKDQWKLRFVADKVGNWRYVTQSNDADLTNHTGTIAVTASKERGFVVANGDKWTRSATGKAFVPQYVMASSLDTFAADPGKLERDLKSFVDEHGFTGFHIRGYCQWFKLGRDACSDISAGDRDPDLKTFEVVENIIKQTYARGGTTHIWMYGDNARRQNPSSWGLNGTADRRLQRYLSARLGALPGWTIGYGYDVGEWASPSQIKSWYANLDNRMMYPHLTSARSDKDVIMQHTDVLSYSSYEQHVPDYQRYVSIIKDRAKKPSFSEDRFRVNAGFPKKDYSYTETRRAMWHSAMAGGVANIWGNMQFSQGGTYNKGSRSYPNKRELKIYSDFIESRFRSNFEICNRLTDGLCLQTPSHSEYIVYKEDARSIKLDLRKMAGSSKYKAMDTTTGKLRTGSFQADQQTWIAPYTADWVLEIKR